VLPYPRRLQSTSRHLQRNPERQPPIVLGAVARDFHANRSALSLHSVWTQQQEIVNLCLYGFQFVASDHEWLTILNSGYVFAGQPSGGHLYRRENPPGSARVKFVPYGTISQTGGAYESGAVLHGSRLFSQGGNPYDSPGGLVNVYDLYKHRPD
jgi:hypothetical protein